ncbi:PREDICTED: sodium/potassium/calcium exchanger 1-like isoform X1 [Cyprinodon variegatus]|uniref:sodium/potassium/calcium exchanger 1-like isoform X1 n=1 Tax=Cyprinodon variegatus TaxID=28743 RepID=UPI0007428F86|nr:PREDICTED: sodium/potassium/calcium exchanger 1-like isoform X1 [Cyprinodon variegatus]XP_015228827.1 PREDICTED: sodium/potassium/calcium exchanger 1-like isoform X1 [Cyprinodon variegatus]
MQFPQRRLNRSRILLFVSGVLLLCIYALSLKSRQPHAPISFNAGADWGGEDDLEVRLREVRASNETELESTKPPLVIIVNRTDLEVCHYVDPRPPRAPPTPPLLTTTAPPQQPLQPPHSKGDYPEDLFSVEQRRQGWVVLHIIGMIYMFVSLAIVCDEFFVPALGVITDKLEISDDVAGATFMAAGGSAPELFTSLIGVFISHSNVGIGTIVGSAVFNILFVIGMCAIFSREMLHLTWWPLFRDINFYILDLIMLIVFFLDNVIWWWESLMLVLGYISYVIFMKFNSQIERTFKNQLNRHRSIVKTWSTTEPEKDCEAAPPPPPPPAAQETNPKPEAAPPAPGSPQHKSLQPETQEDKARLRVRPVLQRGGSSASLHNTSLRSPIFQLMIYTLDPLGEEAALRGAVRTSRPKKATEETSFNGDVKGVRLVKKKAKNKVKPLGVPLTEKQHNKSLYRHVEDTGQKPKSEQSASAGTAGSVAAQPSTSQPPTEENVQKTPDKAEESKAAESEGGSGGSQKSSEEDSGEDESSDSSESKEEDEEDEENKEEEEESEPLTLEWPTTPRKQATYLFLLPIVFPLWLTLPDVRNPASKRFFIATFLGSIFWIGIYSYMMVWWAHQVGETIGISEEIMGLTILAAGTSIPDLITSVIVARKGLGDMAVSSSVGSNIFDITVGLPVPWLIYTALHAGEPVTVSSNGLFCAIVLLFLMLLFVIISIAVCRWKMSKKLGVTMFVLYIVFLVLSVLLENRVLICPISI